jgi:23S rRNA pseudouridine1911/1915/1917 synthase
MTAGGESPTTATTQVIAVSDEHDGLRLDKFLAGEVANHSRAQVQRLIEDGRVKVPRLKVVKANSLVHAGDAVTVEVPEATPTRLVAEDLPLEILYDDPDVVVVNKPAGLVVHPGAGHASGTLVHALLHHVKDLSGIGGEQRPGIVHRLDKGTSGVMVVAKHDQAHQELARQFHDREVEKEYVALVWGVVHNRRRIDLPIGRDPQHREKVSTRARRARHAVTRITWARQLPGVTLIRVAIATGRTHQIRVHLSAIGHAIVGDSVYGGVHTRVQHDIRAVQRLTRPFLHAERLAFTHPRSGERLAFEAALPADLVAVLDEITPAEFRATLFSEPAHAQRGPDNTVPSEAEPLRVRPPKAEP